MSREEPIWSDGPPAFSFLVDPCGFEGPETTSDGLRYRRGDLTVEVSSWSRHHEAGFDTIVAVEARGDEPRRSASLDSLYVACGLGPAQDVPTGGGSRATIRKRIDQHSRALRALMPHLDGPDLPELLRRC